MWSWAKPLSLVVPPFCFLNYGEDVTDCSISQAEGRSWVRRTVRTWRKGGEGIQGFITRMANRSELQSNNDIHGILKVHFVLDNRLTAPMIKSKQNQGNNLCALAFIPRTQPRAVFSRAPTDLCQEGHWVHHWSRSHYCAKRPLRLTLSGGGWQWRKDQWRLRHPILPTYLARGCQELSASPKCYSLSDKSQSNLPSNPPASSLRLAGLVDPRADFLEVKTSSLRRKTHHWEWMQPLSSGAVSTS